MRTPFDYQQIRLVTNAEHADFQEARVPERLQGDLPKLLADALKGKPKVIETLKKLVRNFQKYPVYKNLLYTAYLNAKNYGAAEQVAEQMYRLHPEYTYARANYAESLLRHSDQIKRVAEVLHPSLNITEAFPGRQSFHVGEFIVYERSAIMYLAQSGATEEAERRVQLLSGLDSVERALINQLHLIIDAHRPFEPELPALQTPHLAALYFAGAFMTAAVMRDILQQPREVLVADLCRLLDNLTDRADYWSDDDIPECVGYAPLHAIMLLAELEAEEALPNILRFLSQPEAVVDWWMGDFITELLPEAMARLASPAQYERLAVFSTDRSIDAFTCDIGILGVVRRAGRQPDLRTPAIQWLESVILQLMPDATPGDNNIHLDLAVSAIIDLQAETLLPLAKQAFADDLVDESMAGDYTEFASHITEEDKWPSINNYTNLEQAYDFIHGFDFHDFMTPPPSQADNPWLQRIAVAIAGNPEEAAADWEDDWKYPESPQNVPERVSRNAPCPCGSGKKYKRCHGKEG